MTEEDHARIYARAAEIVGRMSPRRQQMQSALGSNLGNSLPAMGNINMAWNETMNTMSTAFENAATVLMALADSYIMERDKKEYGDG